MLVKSRTEGCISCKHNGEGSYEAQSNVHTDCDVQHRRVLIKCCWFKHQPNGAPGTRQHIVDR